MGRSSLATFRNAITYADKTIYPIASTNKKDYFNLMDVYLDATLNPLLTKEIFKQEGWRYELNSVNDEITLNGVVYNEMKGAYSSTMRMLYQEISENLYPETPYGFSSGGDPVEIPNLTYEEFKDYHSKYYHPSNSYIYFYGDAPLEEELMYVQENFLKSFERKEIDSSIKEQKPFSSQKTITEYYPIGKSEGIDNKTIFALAHTIGNIEDTETILSATILTLALYGSDASPLKRALLNSGIAKDVTFSYNTSLLQPFICLILMNTNPKHKETFNKIYYDTLNQIVKDGIDKELLLSVFNQWEFSLRKRNNEVLRGLYYYLMVLSNWIYNMSPVNGLKMEDLIKKMKAKINEKGYYEGILKKYFIENTHSVFLSFEPDSTIIERREQEIKERLRTLKNSLTKEELEKLVEETNAFRKYQQTPDSKEAIATLPRLSLSDIPTDVPEYTSEIISKDPLILYYDAFANRIAYIDLYFDTKHLTSEELRYLQVLGDLILDTGTDKTSYGDMEKRIMTYTGDMYCGFTSTDKYNDFSNTYFTIKTTVLSDNYSYLSDILTEVITQTSFSDIDRVKEIINQDKVWWENYLRQGDYYFAYSRLASYLTRSGKDNEAINGFEFYKTLLDAVNWLDKDPEGFRTFINNIKKKLFRKENLIANITIEKEHKKGALDVVENVKNILADDNLTLSNRQYAEFTPNEAFVSQSRVQYIGMGVNAYDYGITYNGSFELLMNYLRNTYLYEEVREKGGAYGCFLYFNRNSGQFIILSYRDPQLKNTINVFKNIAKHLETLDISEDDFNNLKISSSKINPLSPIGKGDTAFRNYIYGYKKEDDVRIRKEILDCTIEDIRKYAEFFKKFADKGFISVVGSEKAIMENKDLFSKVINPMD